MTELSQNGAGSVLSWDDQDVKEEMAAASLNFAPSQPANELPPEAAQLMNYLHLANAYLQNPVIAILAKYAAHPEALINGVPNMALAATLKQELAEVSASKQVPSRIRIRCHECNAINSIVPRSE